MTANSSATCTLSDAELSVEPEELLSSIKKDSPLLEASGRTEEATSSSSSSNSDTSSVGEGEPQKKQGKKKTSKGVCFGEVRTHTHARVLGDNPYVKAGLPISFDWKVQASEHFNLEDYEEILKKEHAADADGNKKKKGPKRLASNERYQIVAKAGHRQCSITRVHNEISKVKKTMSKPGDTTVEEDDDDDDNSTCSKSKKKGFLGGLFGMKK